MRRLWLIFSQAATVALAILFVVATLKPQWLSRDGRAPNLLPEVVSVQTAPASVPTSAANAASASAPVGTSALPAAFTGFHAAARAAAPAVVSVTASKPGARNPHAQDPNFRFFFGDRDPSGTEVGYGSGVIVSPEGVLLTNNHVIEGATEINVNLSDGRQARATVVGTDPETDLAVLRIELDHLPAVTLGRIDALQVGDLVLAIGNPFNVGQTVTSGIVSAMGRQGLGLSTFESFIQTDAAINPGNSGGALVDLQGHLVGINTAIFSRSGGSLGIGFAIPVDVAQQVMEGLLRDGQVRRGWIGVEPRDLTPEFAENFKLPVRSGVLITGVLQDGPASKGGMKPGDVVVAVEGKPVSTTAQLLNSVAALRPGEAARFGVQRGGQALEVKVDVVQRPRQVRRPVQR
ncbi:MAG: trypsin-like peptidase domain-containing protein [Ideonella sp.]|nr:trypsin-like peptidase domain-containing protein [Ideonella sp.]MBL0151825.1 trypsin-like peptidase domain-containing protein [Ideonella sp.]